MLDSDCGAVWTAISRTGHRVITRREGARYGVAVGLSPSEAWVGALLPFLPCVLYKDERSVDIRIRIIKQFYAINISAMVLYLLSLYNEKVYHKHLLQMEHSGPAN